MTTPMPSSWWTGCSRSTSGGTADRTTHRWIRPNSCRRDGHFVVGYDNGLPVAMGGWRLSETARAELGFQGRVVELRRMYVIPESRGRGLARSVLFHLETTAASAGADWMVLETGEPQPEAVALYRSSGYEPIAAFGHYATSTRSIHLGKRLSPAP